MKHAPILVLGATMAGTALALSRPADTLVVERSMLFGTDYLGSLNIKRCRPDLVRQPLALDFRDELFRRNLLNDAGEVHAQRIAGVLANRLRNSGAGVLLLTEVVAISPRDEGYEVVLYNADGYTTVHAGQIIDTTSDGYFLDPSQRPPIQKSLCAALAVPAGAVLTSCCPTGGQILQGRFADEFVLKVALDAADGWVAARARLNACWQECRSRLPDGCAIAAIATEWAVDFQIEPADHVDLAVHARWRWHPSASYQDLLSAFAGGARCLNTD